MRKYLFIPAVLLCVILSGCGEAASIGIIGGSDGPTSIVVSKKGEKDMYEQITPEDAIEIMDSGEDIVILDVREQDEFNEGHIVNAVLLPYTQVEEKADEIIPDKDKTILVYCRSGRRSKIAAETLSRLGYTDVKEFGGIIDWNYDLVK